ncbi:MAG: NAD(+) synthase [Kiritimatiellae bacterium]|nr:NAD(+) synthase [Kiritimatiellia bacterium]
MNGFVRLAACSPEVRPGDVRFNAARICESYLAAAAEGAAAAVFPELALTGRSCGDFFGIAALRQSALDGLSDIAAATSGRRCLAVCGLPLDHRGLLFDAAAVVGGGRVLGIVLARFPDSGLARHFSPAIAFAGQTAQIGGESVPVGADLVFAGGDGRSRFGFGVEIGADAESPLPPSSTLALAGAEVVFHLSSNPELAGGAGKRRIFAKAASARIRGVYASVNPGVGESAAEEVFSGHCLIAQRGGLLAESSPFSSGAQTIFADVNPSWCDAARRAWAASQRAAAAAECREVAVPAPPSSPDLKFARIVPHPFVPEGPDRLAQRCEEVFSIQTAGLAGRWKTTGAQRLVVGLSGGLDSTLAVLACAAAADALGKPRQAVLALTMPGFGTTSRTRGNAEKLALALGAELRTVAIGPAVESHFGDIGHDPSVRDVTYENAQARERTQILMDIANDERGFVVGTGDLSEIALGWCTYNGDQMSMYCVNGGVPKTLMRHVVTWAADRAASAGLEALAGTLRDIVATPVSPELLPGGAEGQKTEGILGKYDLHDFFLYHAVKHGESRAGLSELAASAFCGIATREEIDAALDTFLRRFATQQFKRDASPAGPKTGSVSLSPRGGWCAPSSFPAVF